MPTNINYHTVCTSCDDDSLSLPVRDHEPLFPTDLTRSRGEEVDLYCLLWQIEYT